MLKSQKFLFRSFEKRITLHFTIELNQCSDLLLSKLGQIKIINEDKILLVLNFINQLFTQRLSSELVHGGNFLTLACNGCDKQTDDNVSLVLWGLSSVGEHVPGSYGNFNLSSKYSMRSLQKFDSDCLESIVESWEVYGAFDEMNLVEINYSPDIRFRQTEVEKGLTTTISNSCRRIYVYDRIRTLLFDRSRGIDVLRSRRIRLDGMPFGIKLGAQNVTSIFTSPRYVRTVFQDV